MRTDSTNLSETALTAARTQARELYGDAYVPAEPRIYTRKVKNAQEAHEAIRPAGDTFRTPGRGRPTAVLRRVPALRADLAAHAGLADVRRGRHDGVGAHRRRRRSPASGPSSPRPAARSPSPASCAPTSRTPTRAAARRTTRRSGCRSWRAATAWTRGGSAPTEHNTSPPARYTEPSLVKALEELGDRPAVHLRLDHADDPGPRLRVEEGRGARPVLDGVRGRRPARVLLRPAGRLRLHRLGRERPGRHRQRRRRRASTGCAASTSAPTAPSAARTRRGSPRRAA